MDSEAKVLLGSLRGRMQGFLQVGLVEDEVLYARELRKLRTDMTRVIVALEAGPALLPGSDSGCTS